MSTNPPFSGANAIDGLHRLAAALTDLRLALDLERSIKARGVRDELADQISDYLIPRLARLDGPLLAVFGGSTGSGKSTITNSLVGREVTPAGVLRPTTRAPVLITHPADAGFFDGNSVLPDLPRSTGDISSGPMPTGAVLRISETDAIGPGLAIIDAPDIDSVEEANRLLATQLLAAADLWLFTTTAVRYADAVPWEFLTRARERGTALAIVINRIPQGASKEIKGHLQQMLVDAGFADIPIYTVNQGKLIDERLPETAVAEIRAALASLANNADMRNKVIAKTLHGALDSVSDRAAIVSEAGTEEQATATGLLGALDSVYVAARKGVASDLSNGSLLRNEVLDRWQELIGSAELMRAIQSRVSIIRDKITGFIRGRTGSTVEVQGEITSTLERLLVDHADQAALNAWNSWRALPGGPQVLGDDRHLERTDPGIRDSVGQEVRGWQDDILELVRQRGEGKRTTARALALGVNSIGVALMIVVLASTGGLTGAEIGISAGTAGLSQALLAAVFGEQAVRDLAVEARQLLLNRIDRLLDSDADRYRTKLASIVDPPEAITALQSALAEFEKSR